MKLTEANSFNEVLNALIALTQKTTRLIRASELKYKQEILKNLQAADSLSRPPSPFPKEKRFSLK